jgi:predicted site-specific integrase-resolvase
MQLPLYDRVLMPKEAQELVQVSRRDLYRWEREGKVSALRTARGAHRRYLESEVIAAALDHYRGGLSPRKTP